MSKGAQLWPNERMRAFFMAHIRRETTLDEEAAQRLAEALLKSTNRMLVWDAPDAASAADTGKTQKAAAAATAKSKTGDAKQAHTPVAKPFDPYAFSAMVTLAKQGRDGLAKRLTEIKSAENLKAFADAQHLGIDRKLSKPDELRKAILTAAELRLADRKAAAS